MLLGIALQQLWLQNGKKKSDAYCMFAESIINYGGLALLVFVVFAETGLMVGFFLPGDYLIFLSGLFCNTKPELINVSLLPLELFLAGAAITGNLTGYYFGKKAGPSLFNKDDNLIFKKRYVEVTREFYSRNGGKSLVLGRFLPIVRTFAPILAGVIKMDFKLFLFHTVVGAILWIGSLCTAGFYLGEIEWVRENVEWIVIGLIVLTAIPLIRTYNKEKKLNREKKK